MADMIDLDSLFEHFRAYEKHFSVSITVLITHVQLRNSIINEEWPSFIIISDVNFTLNSPSVPCILSSAKANGCFKIVLKLFQWYLRACKWYLSTFPNQYY